ncbi:MAG TPA: nitrogen regulation protein NR(I) [Gammaproteobacteria bacterium]|nr:nitrogen regulation protein NR(I) [Gammaproteobacteria bacterium]
MRVTNSSDCDVWIVDDDSSIRWVLEKALAKAGIASSSFENAEDALLQLKNSQPDVIISDIRMPGMGGLELLERLREECPELPVIVITAHSDLDSAVAAYHGGAFEYLPKPFDIEEVVDKVQRACRHANSDAVADAPLSEMPEIIGEAPAMQEVFRAIGKLARSNITVLITGETGTGKELVAKALHRHSPRAANPFIAINTAAIPRDLLESELFGHERGAFTGATERRTGRFEQADGGTLFLDEIGDMPADLQTRLLRVLADGEFYRVGGRKPVKVDVRVIAATHQDLEQLVKDKLFREDLMHRLNVIRIHIPALRERREDIPLLMNKFLASSAEELHEETKELLPETALQLSHFEWPGNVRQLENTARLLTVMAAGKSVHIQDLPVEMQKFDSAEVRGEWQAALKLWATQWLLQNSDQPLLDTAVPEFERIMIEAALESSGGTKNEAALRLGWGRNTLTRKMQALGIDEE